MVLKFQYHILWEGTEIYIPAPFGQWYYNFSTIFCGKVLKLKYPLRLDNGTEISVLPFSCTVVMKFNYHQGLDDGI